MAKLKITQTTDQTSVNYPMGQGDKFISPTLINGNHIGGVGGLTSQTGLQIKPTVFVTGSAAAGSILAQKGAHKFRVTDGTNTGTCTLTNSTTLAAGQMNLWANVCVIPSAAIAAANVAGGATSTYVTWTAGTTIGPVATPRVGDYISGFSSSSIGSSGAVVTAINTASNVTVGLTGNVAASTVLANSMTLVSRITNKFVSDFNANKFRYVLGGNAVSASASISGGFARVISG